MSGFDIVTERAPACWASALINGDDSGLEDDEAAKCAEWIAGFAPCSVVNCSDESYIARFEGLLSDCMDYEIIIFHKG